MAKLTIYGGCVYCNISLEEEPHRVEDKNEYLRQLKNNPLHGITWGKDTVMKANFSNPDFPFSGSNFEGVLSDGKTYSRLDHYRIYKTHSKQPKLHKVFESDSASETIFEDFTVGSLCDYTYYLVPVCKTSSGVETIGGIVASQPILLNDGTVRVIGLIQDDKDLDTYYVDMNNVWNFSLNINNTGFTNNMGKTYNDTPQKYPIEVKNKGFYRTFNINGLLGKFDCDTMEYVDTYDDIIEWENFVDNGEMKLVIDLRGIMTVGTTESNSIEYDEHGANLVSANFSIKQLEDMDKITILNRSLIINLNDTTQELLYEADSLAVQDIDSNYLIVSKEVE